MCPDPEVLAAFLAESVSAEERALIVKHLATCETCLTEMAEVVKCESEVPVESTPRRFQSWWLASAAAAAFVFIALPFIHRAMPGANSMSLLVAAAQSADRTIEPRLSGGFAWRPMRPVMRGGRDSDAKSEASRMKLISAVGTILERAAKDTSSESRHAAALAHVFAGDTQEGARLLKEIAPATNDPRILSNLAALLYVQAAETYARAPLIQALAAADSALRLDPDLPEALFNRALILERLDRPKEAHSAWHRYLAVDPASPWAAEARNHIRRLEEETNSNLEEAISAAVSSGEVTRAFESIERSRMSHPIGVAALTASLASDDVVLQYLSLHSSLITFVIDRDGARAVQTTVSREALSKEIDAVATAAAAGSESQFNAAASALYARLLAPIAHDVTRAHKLIIITDGLPGDVPFAALRDSNGQYLIENHPVVATPSASMYAQLVASSLPPASHRHILLVPGPSREDTGLSRLFFAGREVDAIAKVYDSRTERTITGDDSTLRSHAAAADVIHFAGHSVTPLGSNEPALVTLGEGDTTSYLTASEIAKMRLPRTRAVVLAACNTAGSLDTRSTRLSLADAFLAAGVSSVVATLWPINDQAASEFYPRLHHYLARGLAPADALRATQLECIHRGGASSRMWTAVQAVGS